MSRGGEDRQRGAEGGGGGGVGDGEASWWCSI